MRAPNVVSDNSNVKRLRSPKPIHSHTSYSHLTGGALCVVMCGNEHMCELPMSNARYPCQVTMAKQT